MILKQLKKLIRHTNQAQRNKLYEWLGELVREDREMGSRGTTGSRAGKVEESADGRTYRFESVRCGKKGCMCADGELHGRYWYADWSETGKTKSRYVGKKPRGKKARRTVKVS